MSSARPKRYKISGSDWGLVEIPEGHLMETSYFDAYRRATDALLAQVGSALDMGNNYCMACNGGHSWQIDAALAAIREHREEVSDAM